MRTLIVDFNALYHRSYHALSSQGLKTSSGEYTFAIYGFLKTLFSQIDEYRPDLIFVANDAPRSTLYRKIQYPSYKANRGPDSGSGEALDPEADVFRYQKRILLEILRGLKIPVLRYQGYEADDVIWTLIASSTVSVDGQVYKPEQRHHRVLTCDRDLLQCVRPGTEVYIWQSVGKDCLLKTDEEVVSYFGVRPNQIAGYKALVGDSSDNVAGIKGFGPKMGADFFAVYDSLFQGREDNFQKLKPRARNLILENTDVVDVAHRLVTLYSILELQILTLQSDQVQSFDFVDRWEFPSLRKSCASIKIPAFNCVLL